MSRLQIRWRAKLAIRVRLLSKAHRSLGYWQRRLHRASKWSKDYSHARSMVEARKHLVDRRRAQVNDARKVLARHSLPTGISDKGLEFIKEHEGFRANIYIDAVGVRTVGYGTTGADVQPLPRHLSEEQASRLLEDRVDKKYAPPVLRALAPMHPTQGMVDACISFAYNLGPGGFEGAHGFEALQRALRSRNRRKVADALLLYSNPGTSVHAALLARRQAERRMFLS
jgi:GH24 family phage-related lysozyme (muramidase)